MQYVLYIINRICKNMQNLFLFNSLFLNNSLLKNDGKLLQINKNNEVETDKNINKKHKK